MVMKMRRCLSRVNLSAYFQKIFGAEKELIWLLAHILAQKEAFNVSLYQTIDVIYWKAQFDQKSKDEASNDNHYKSIHHSSERHIQLKYQTVTSTGCLSDE